jgi:hypothetical protein
MIVNYPSGRKVPVVHSPAIDYVVLTVGVIVVL